MHQTSFRLSTPITSLPQLLNTFVCPRNSYLSTYLIYLISLPKAPCSGSVFTINNSNPGYVSIPSSSWITPHDLASLAARQPIRPATALTVVPPNVTIVETRVTSVVIVPKAPRTTRLATDAVKAATSAVSAPKAAAVQLVVVVVARADLKSAISAVRSAILLAIALMPTAATRMVAATVEVKARLAILAAAMDTCLASV
ncbi:hypothetical protein F5X97DRAFT_114451 [Nemania serpens]|nr:hypothetical protein F5X97DRAFT_114451 [Nemania serpens]